MNHSSCRTHADAIVGVAYFSEMAAEDFATFDLSFVALFRVASGEAWIESLPAHNPDGGVATGPVWL